MTIKLSGQFGKAAALESWTGSEALGLNTQDEEGSFAKGPTNHLQKDIFVEQSESKIAEKNDDKSLYKGGKVDALAQQGNKVMQPDPNKKPLDAKSVQVLNTAQDALTNKNALKAPEVGKGTTGDAAGRNVAQTGAEAAKTVTALNAAAKVVADMKKDAAAAKPVTPTSNTANNTAGAGQGSMVTQGQGNTLNKVASKDEKDGSKVAGNDTAPVETSSSPSVQDSRLAGTSTAPESQAFLDKMSKGFGGKVSPEDIEIAEQSIADPDMKVQFKGKDLDQMSAQMDNMKAGMDKLGVGYNNYVAQTPMAAKPSTVYAPSSV